MRRRIVVLALGFVLSGRSGLADTLVGWAEDTASPRKVAMGDRGLGSVCAESDAGLGVVASQMARHEIAADDAEALTYALRAAGEPHVWPRALTLAGRALDPRDARSRIDKWLASFRHRGRLRCAVASAEASGKETVAVVAVDAQADLEPLALVARPSSWVEVNARVLVPAYSAKVVVMGPSGAPRTVPTSFAGGRARARANLDRPGAWVIQVVVDGEAGPRPVLEAFVFAGVAPPSARPTLRAPGEEIAGDGTEALGEMITAARASEGLASLRPSRALDGVAAAHAERMKRASELGHDVGDGDVRRRVEDAGIDATRVGENVAHAATLALAHRALWASPSHRDNILGARYSHVGIGVARDVDGSVWVTELFAGN